MSSAGKAFQNPRVDETDCRQILRHGPSAPHQRRWWCGWWWWWSTCFAQRCRSNRCEATKAWDNIWNSLVGARQPSLLKYMWFFKHISSPRVMVLAWHVFYETPNQTNKNTFLQNHTKLFTNPHKTYANLYRTSTNPHNAYTKPWKTLRYLWQKPSNAYTQKCEACTKPPNSLSKPC
jgi:hypothetical protein